MVFDKSTDCGSRSGIFRCRTQVHSPTNHVTGVFLFLNDHQGSCTYWICETASEKDMFEINDEKQLYFIPVMSPSQQHRK